jgi:hypothetical protein
LLAGPAERLPKILVAASLGLVNVVAVGNPVCPVDVFGNPVCPVGPDFSDFVPHLVDNSPKITATLTNKNKKPLNFFPQLFFPHNIFFTYFLSV